MPTSLSKPNTAFWIITVVAIFWNLVGVASFFAQIMMTPETLAALPEAERTLYENMPVWVLVAFAVAVFGGLGGSIALALKKAIATALFSASLVGVIVQLIYNFVIANTMEVYGASSIILPLVVLIIAIFLVWYSKDARKKGTIA
ncbi:MAG: hypothetical protein DHS20C05_02680 [Hyphococcus sp.]|nr:MAG: hypothetical protein DHS20C05_02680 [Marinicaulis sp.]